VSASRQGGLALTRAPLPLPQSRAAEEGEEDESEGANYQLEMMRCLREVNVDNNTVGWRVRCRQRRAVRPALTARLPPLAR